jgi:hypothetical protein
MSRFRRLAIAATAVALAGIPATAPAAQSGSLRGLVLDGKCGDTSELKNVRVAPRTPYLFAPVRLHDANFTPMRTWLFPYSVTVVGGNEEGLKSRHLTPGETYTRPGKPPRHQVTCVFDGRTKEEGDFTVTIKGALR